MRASGNIVLAVDVNDEKQKAEGCIRSDSPQLFAFSNQASMSAQAAAAAGL